MRRANKVRSVARSESASVETSVAPQLGVRVGFSRFRSVVARFTSFYTKIEMRQTIREKEKDRRKRAELNGCFSLSSFLSRIPSNVTLGQARPMRGECVF